MSVVSFARGAAALLLFAACAGSEGSRTSPDAEAGAMAETTSLAATVDDAETAVCELPSGGYAEACNGCLAARCCAPLEACKSDGTCGEQLRCIIECQSAESPTQCSTACAEDGFHAGYAAYDDCSFSECLSECWM